MKSEGEKIEDENDPLGSNFFFPLILKLLLLLSSFSSENLSKEERLDLS